MTLVTLLGGRASRGLCWLALLGLALVPALGAGPARAADHLEDLLFDLQLIPLDGQSPPPFRLADVDGKAVALADWKGHVVLLYFWATW